MWDRLVARGLMSMSDETWARHANPWSGWSRLATTPVLFLALWSHVWLGWRALAPVALVALWLWLNPRVFPPPARTDAWMSRGVLGERLWLARRTRPIPARHVRPAMAAQGLSLGFLAAGVWGLVAQDFWAAFLGLHGAAVAKLWFVDRMVWLHEDMTQGENRS